MARKRLFFTVFVLAHVLCIFLQTYQHALYINQSYRAQKNSKMYAALVKQKNSLEQQLHAMHNRELIQQYATNTLGMHAMKLQQIKKVSNI